MPTLTDAGPLISLIDGADSSHALCRSALPSLARPMVTTWPCYTEAMYFLGKSVGYAGQKALWRLRSSGELVIHQLSGADGDRMEALMEEYEDIPMDLADASLVTVAEVLSLRRVFTLDSHFYAYRTADKKALEVTP